MDNEALRADAKFLALQALDMVNGFPASDPDKTREVCARIINQADALRSPIQKEEG